MTEFSGSEERAKVQSFQPNVAPPTDPASVSDAAHEECKRAIYRPVFEVLDWDLEDETDINEALDKIYIAAENCGWHFHVGTAMEELSRVHQFPTTRRMLEKAYALGRDQKAENDVILPRESEVEEEPDDEEGESHR